MPYSPAVPAFVLALSLCWGEVIASEQQPNLQFSGTYRLRFEALDNAYRALARGGDQLLASRLFLQFSASRGQLFGAVELQDARTWLDDEGTPLGTDDVNAAEPLQLYAGWRQTIQDGGTFAAKAGRMTLDIGSRRLVARNRFRNTSNAFTALHAEWSKAAWRVQGLYAQPVDRRPATRRALDNNDFDLDETQTNVDFFGLHIAHVGKAHGLVSEGYVFTLREGDATGIATRNRDLVTMGGRVLRTPGPGRWDFEIEAAFQFGESRQSTAASDTVDLDHRAVFAHAHIGYQWDLGFAPHLAFHLDRASGDKGPTDAENNRFDTLFGARRFDFGPTGIYGAFQRSNLSSAGLRIGLKPRSNLSAFLMYRSLQLASARDGLATAGLTDAAGASGKSIGRQLEASALVTFSKALDLEFGAALLAKGRFLKQAPGAPQTGDTTYWYTSVTYDL